MTTQLKENNFLVANSVENAKDTPVIKNSRKERPNIDHLIKRIIVERRKEQRKNLLIFLFLFLAISGIIIASINS
jgi:hypothetical protein